MAAVRPQFHVTLIGMLGACLGGRLFYWVASSRRVSFTGWWWRWLFILLYTCHHILVPNLASKFARHLQLQLGQRARHETSKEHKAAYVWRDRLQAQSVEQAVLQAIALKETSAGRMTPTPTTTPTAILGLFAQGDPVGIFLFNLGKALLILLVALILAQSAKRWIVRLLTRSRRININVASLVGNLVQIAIVALGIINLLTAFGVDLASLVTVLGVAGLAISLSLQDLLRNVVAGIYVLLEQPFKIGDRISVKDVTGVVQGYRATHDPAAHRRRPASGRAKQHGPERNRDQSLDIQPAKDIYQSKNRRWQTRPTCKRPAMRYWRYCRTWIV